MQQNRKASPECSHAQPGKPSKAALAAAVRDARARCIDAGLRWTSQRERALELLFTAGGPVKAYDLLADFKTGGGATAPPTVYRALDTLVELGVVHRIASLNAYVVCHHTVEGHAASFLICDCCGSVEEIEAPSEDVLTAVRAQSAFQMSSLTIEVHGRCSRCQA